MSSALDEFKKSMEEWARAILEGKPMGISYALQGAVCPGVEMMESTMRSIGCA